MVQTMREPHYEGTPERGAPARSPDLPVPMETPCSCSCPTPSSPPSPRRCRHPAPAALNIDASGAAPGTGLSGQLRHRATA